jgi:hypothetical protein
VRALFLKRPSYGCTLCESTPTITGLAGPIFADESQQLADRNAPHSVQEPLGEANGAHALDERADGPPLV